MDIHYNGKHREVTLKNIRHGQKAEKQPGNCANIQLPNKTKRNKVGRIIQHVEVVKTKNATEKKLKLMEPKKIPHKCFLLQNNLIKTRIQYEKNQDNKIIELQKELEI